MKINTIVLTLAALAGITAAQADPELQINYYTGSVGSGTLQGTQTITGADAEAQTITAPSGLTLDIKTHADGTTGGTGTAPSFDLDVKEVSTTAGIPGYITIAYSDTDFGPTDQMFTVTSGGSVQNLTSPATVSSATYYSTSDLNFAETTLITSSTISPYTSPGPAGSGMINSGSSLYSMTEVLTLSGSGTGTLSIDLGGSTGVPDGATTALLVGAGLLGMGVFASRRKLTLA